ncbi:acetate--CoA ligase family protein [Sphingobium phenoxybenzoativorans]|uniref:acetate--CoA ligase family protein n=1 Tax=Sphingobium phenoxybenzoativorans TaxID=1592790 RepID=UPI000871E5BE|nr:acetate--CoA ligase family protein [Sphingobium phenoxybenzoativorans]
MAGTAASIDLGAGRQPTASPPKRPNLGDFLAPRSIAIVGASADPATIRGRLLDYLLQRNYAGALYLVSPSQPEIRGRKTYPTLASIGEPIDLVLIATRADVTLSIVEECARIGARFAICYSSGFAEAGEEGEAAQRRLGEIAAETGLRICGPNTAGFFNVRDEIPATFARNVDESRAAIASGRTGAGTVTVVAQSGGLGYAMSDRCRAEHGLDVNFVISTGNEADLGTLDFVDHVIEDEGTKAILLLVEALKDTARLPVIAAHALAAGKPIIVSKFGRTEAGSRAINSHAGRLTGSSDAYDAVFARYGLLSTDDENEMADLAAAFSLFPLPQGNRVAIMTTSGGAGVWMADACEAAGLAVPILDDATQAELAKYVPSYGATHNPVDLTAQVTVNPLGGAAESPLVASLAALHDSDGIDAVILIANMSDGNVLAREQAGLSALAARLRKPVLLYSHAPASPKSLQLAQEIGLSVFASTRRVARTLGAMVRYAETRGRIAAATQPAPAPALPAADVAALAGGLSEYKAKALLARHGLQGGSDVLAHSVDDAVAAARVIAAPVALKIQSDAIQHKTEVGGVALGLEGDDAVRAAYEQMMASVTAKRPDAALDGILVQKMLKPGTEFALGIVRDPDFGAMMMAGLGGVYIEVLKDVMIEPLPVRRDTALAMLKRLQAWPVLDGARGRAPLDVEALTAAMEQLSLLVEGSGDAVREIDLNPVFVYPKGEGIAIADALVVGRDEPSIEGAH